MEPQSKGHEESGNEGNREDYIRSQLRPDIRGVSQQAEQISDGLQDTTSDEMSLEPTEADYENGAREAMAFLSDTIGRTIPPEKMDEATQRVLYEINQARSKWSASMERDAAAALQSIYPDNRGSAQGGPL